MPPASNLYNAEIYLQWIDLLAIDFDIVPGLCWVLTHRCSESVRTFFGADPGFIGYSRTKSEQSQKQYKSKPGVIWENTAKS